MSTNKPKLTPEEKRARNRAYCKAWRDKNPEKAKASVKAWSDKNQERVKARIKAWRQKNPERVKLYQKKRTDRRRETNKAWRENNPDRARQYMIAGGMVQKVINTKTLKKATQHRQPWEPVDDAWLMEFTGTAKESALHLGRSFFSIGVRKMALRRQNNQLP